MKKSKITQKDILFLAVSMFVVVLAWIIFNLYHTYVTTTISEDLQMQILPIDPTFDTNTIDILKSRTEVLPIFEVNQNSLSPTPSPTTGEKTPSETTNQEPKSITPTEEASPSAGPTITP